MMTNRYICFPPNARVSKIRQCETFLTTANQKGRRAFIELGRGDVEEPHVQVDGQCHKNGTPIAARSLCHLQYR
jgi:hypothetical protein